LATDLIPKNRESPIAFRMLSEMDMIVINGKKSLHLSDLGLNAELKKTTE
jgi:hypothetical protein